MKVHQSNSKLIFVLRYSYRHIPILKHWVNSFKKNWSGLYGRKNSENTDFCNSVYEACGTYMSSSLNFCKPKHFQTISTEIKLLSRFIKLQLFLSNFFVSCVQTVSWIRIMKEGICHFQSNWIWLASASERNTHRRYSTRQSTNIFFKLITFRVQS